MLCCVKFFSALVIREQVTVVLLRQTAALLFCKSDNFFIFIVCHPRGTKQSSGVIVVLSVTLPVKYYRILVFRC